MICHFINVNELCHPQYIHWSKKLLHGGLIIIMILFLRSNSETIVFFLIHGSNDPCGHDQPSPSIHCVAVSGFRSPSFFSLNFTSYFLCIVKKFFAKFIINSKLLCWLIDRSMDSSPSFILDNDRNGCVSMSMSLACALNLSLCLLLSHWWCMPTKVKFLLELQNYGGTSTTHNPLSVFIY